MSRKKPRTSILAVLLLLFAASGARANGADCDGLVIDVIAKEAAPKKHMAADVYVASKMEVKIRPGRIFKVFRPESVAEEPTTRYPLKLYVGRLQVIDVQEDVLIGRMIELASKKEFAGVRYETVMVGDCLRIEPPTAPPTVSVEELGAEAVDVESLKLSIPIEARLAQRAIPSTVLFKFDSARIEEEWADELKEMAGFIAMNKPAKVFVGGHADWIGTDSYNVNLSRRRARALVDYMTTRHGLDRNIFEIAPHGESDPRATNLTATGRQLNRRAIVSFFFRTIPAAEVATSGGSEWPAVVEPELLVPEDADFPVIPSTPPSEAPPASGS